MIPWAFIFQIAAPIGNALITALLDLFRKDAQGIPPTEADWKRLGDIYGLKTPEAFLEESLRKLAPETPVPDEPQAPV